MRRLLLFWVLFVPVGLMAASACSGQGNDAQYWVLHGDDGDRIFDVTDEQPQYPGGQGELIKFVNNNLRYPKVAQEQHIEGKVIVRFAVMKDGTVANASIVRSSNEALNNEAIRLVKAMPQWNPAKQKGAAVNCWFTLPIVFRLSNE